MRTIPKLILASKSPRRQALLKQIGIEDFEILPAESEDRPDEGDPAEYVLRLARQKAESAAGLSGAKDIILAADTIVRLDGDTLEKPENAAEARRMLKSLSGRTHTVYTGVTVRCGGREEGFCETAEVTFRDLPDEEIEQYIASGEPFDKAGAYGVQGIGARFVTRIAGDYSCVVGLPLSKTYLLLKDFGLSV